MYVYICIYAYLCICLYKHTHKIAQPVANDTSTTWDTYDNRL